MAQNLASKLGVEVMAPTDTLWAFPSGQLTVGPLRTCLLVVGLISIPEADDGVVEGWLLPRIAAAALPRIAAAARDTGNPVLISSALDAIGYNRPGPAHPRKQAGDPGAAGASTGDGPGRPARPGRDRGHTHCRLHRRAACW